MYIGIDLGTSGVKAILLSPQGEVLAAHTEKLEVSRPHPLWSEQDPEQWWLATDRAMKALGEQHSLREVHALGIAGQMHGATLAREHTMLTPDLAERYLQSCEIALQRCQQRLEYDAPGESGDANILEAPETLTHGPMSTLEQHLQRILGHLSTMHTISSVAWRQRPHHGIWLTRILKRTPY
jgi:uncharacterized membrane protein YccC